MNETLLDVSIADIFDRFPMARTVFEGNGLRPLTDEETLRTIGKTLTLRKALTIAEINPEVFIGVLEAQISVDRSFGAECSAVESDSFGALDVFASFPCPLKVPMESALQTLLEEIRHSGLKLNTSLDACNQLKYNDTAGDIEKLEDLPELIVSSGINSFLSHGFRERFLNTGKFYHWPEQRLNPRLEKLGLTDPDGHYWVISINLFIIAIDKTRIGSLPIPRSWSELLTPKYAGSTAMCAHGDWFNESLLVGVHELYGDEGLRSLGRTVRYGMHPSQFIKHLGSGKPETPAIAIVPLFFAKTAKNQDDIEIVWPTDGTLASPLFMLVKECSRDRLKEVIHFFSGPAASEICSGAFFPSLHPEAHSEIPDNAPIHWLGWQYLKNNDPAELQHHCTEVFRAAHYSVSSE